MYIEGQIKNHHNKMVGDTQPGKCGHTGTIKELNMEFGYAKTSRTCWKLVGECQGIRNTDKGEGLDRSF